MITKGPIFYRKHLFFYHSYLNVKCVQYETAIQTKKGEKFAWKKDSKSFTILVNFLPFYPKMQYWWKKDLWESDKLLYLSKKCKKKYLLTNIPCWLFQRRNNWSNGRFHFDIVISFHDFLIFQANFYITFQFVCTCIEFLAL